MVYQAGAQLMSGWLQGSAGPCSVAPHQQHVAFAPSCQGVEAGLLSRRLCFDATEHSGCQQRHIQRQRRSPGCCAALVSSNGKN